MKRKTCTAVKESSLSHSPHPAPSAASPPTSPAAPLSSPIHQLWGVVQGELDIHSPRLTDGLLSARVRLQEVC